MKKIKRITAILFILIVCAMMFEIVNCQVLASSNFNLNAFNDEVSATDGVKNLVNTTAGTAISIMRIICVTIAIVILLTISMKYMISAPGDRADIKKHAIHYVIGAIILFGVTGILGIINEFANNI